MLELWQAILLGAIQGATEFLPVSSSGHLVLGPALLRWPSPPLAFNVALHWATAAAVVLYFRSDWLRISRGTLRAIGSRSAAAEPDARLAAYIAFGTVPAAVIGLGLHSFFEAMFAAPSAAAAMLVVTGAILILAETFRGQRRSDDYPNAIDSGDQADGQAAAVNATRALAIGLAQAMAIFPGISRSGATIAAGLAVGLPREEAARFSFLLATPAIVGAGILELGDLAASGIAPEITASGMLTAFLVGYASIAWMLSFVRRHKLYPFALYVIVVGVVAFGLLRGAG